VVRRVVHTHRLCELRAARRVKVHAERMFYSLDLTW
jgi:hypothetical protein